MRVLMGSFADKQTVSDKVTPGRDKGPVTDRAAD